MTTLVGIIAWILSLAFPAIVQTVTVAHFTATFHPTTVKKPVRYWFASSLDQYRMTMEGEIEVSPGKTVSDAPVLRVICLMSGGGRVSDIATIPQVSLGRGEDGRFAESILNDWPAVTPLNSSLPFDLTAQPTRYANSDAKWSVNGEASAELGNLPLVVVNCTGKLTSTEPSGGGKPLPFHSLLRFGADGRLQSMEGSIGNPPSAGRPVRAGTVGVRIRLTRLTEDSSSSRSKL